MAKKAFEYEITEELGVLSESDKSDWCTRVNKISFNKALPKLDIRKWDMGKDKMAKGISLTDEEANRLAIILVKEGYLTREEFEGNI